MSETPNPENPQTPPAPKKASVWKSMKEKVTDVGEAIGNTAKDAGQKMAETASHVGETLGTAGKKVAETTQGAGKKMAETATQVGETLGNTASSAGKVASQAGQTAAKQTQYFFGQATQGAGKVVDFVGNNPLLRYATQVLKVDWLVGVIGRVDVVKAKAAVTELQAKHPDESSSQIAHRIMLEKALYAGGIGLTSSLIPGVAAATIGVDILATTLLQAEMVYQIAAAYGMELEDPERKGEVLAIFGLALGGSQAIKAGLGLLRTVPAAGAAIGASANAAMLYSLGYAACRFYEAKEHPLTSEETLKEVQTESENYQEKALEQQVIVDQILVHLFVAGQPRKTWEELWPEIQKLNLSPASLEVVSQNLKSPSALESLLPQVNQDFAVSLIAQCEKIAALDGITSPEEAEMIERIKMVMGNR